MTYRIIQGDCIEGMRQIADESVHCVVTSPPYYGLRDYGVDGQIGLEESPEAYVARLVDVFREVRRILRDDGTVWLNLGDSYGAKKQLLGIPWRVAFALQADDWYLRQDIIWHKPNPMPESVTDRCTKSHEYIFLLSKSARYYFDHEAIKEPSKYEWNSAKSFSSGGARASIGLHTAQGSQWNGTKTHTDEYKTGRNKRSVWTVATRNYKGAHFATFPTTLIEPCVLAGCPIGGTVFDPFTGSGTTAFVALTNGRSYIGTELNPAYIEIAERRLSQIQPRMELS
jgi:site-specific DNA-methyltransferase (adenine-specific)